MQYQRVLWEASNVELEMFVKTTDTRQDVILDSINEGVFTVDLDWRITAFNRAAEGITGVPRAEAIGQPCCEVFRASICENACVLKRGCNNEKKGNRQHALIGKSGECLTH